MEVRRNNDLSLDIMFDDVINLENHSQVKNTIMDNLSEDYSSLRLDFSRVRYIDSSGLGLLIFLEKLVRNEKKVMRIRSVSDDTMRIFKLSGLDKFFTFSD